MTTATADDESSAAPVAPDTAEELTDMEFLEYLGSWEGSDEAWFALAATDELTPDASDEPKNDEDDLSEN